MFAGQRYIGPKIEDESLECTKSLVFCVCVQFRSREFGVKTSAEELLLLLSIRVHCGGTQHICIGWKEGIQVYGNQC